MRSINRTYQDPLDVVWLHAATQMGMKVVRDSHVFAAWDGNGTLTIGSPETLDPDDSLAQMILHETCHALTEGPDSWNRPDWGLQIFDPAQRVREHACLRLQAAITSPFGLRDFLAATTNFRRYYDQLPEDPLSEDGDPATALANEGMRRAVDGPIAEPLQRALRLTSEIAVRVQPCADETSLWAISLDVAKTS